MNEYSTMPNSTTIYFVSTEYETFNWKNIKVNIYYMSTVYQIKLSLLGVSSLDTR